jgi:FAD/FMN-containing dehydrogenase
MNKIIRVNAANRVAIVEPGVTFSELQSELAKSGLCAYIPLAPRGSKSVLASVLERDPILMPGVHFDSTDPMLCVEIVFGTGDKMRTGEAAGPDTLEGQWEIGKAQISPFGPTQMDPQRLVSGAQGTIGIVTWMSLKCRFLSELSRAFLVPSATLEPLIELSYWLTRIRFTGNIFILNGLNLACLLRRTPKEIAALSDKLPPWVMFVSCEGYGPLPEQKVQYLETDLKEIAGSYGLKIDTAVGGVKAEELASLLAMPSPEPYWKLRLKGGFDEVFFLTTQGKTPEFARIMVEIAQQQGYPAGNIGVYIQPVVQGTSCHCEFDLYYDLANQAESEKTRKVVSEVANKMEARGAFFSRPYREWVEAAYRRSRDTVDMQKKVKEIFDPNGILNPGKLCF